MVGSGVVAFPYTFQQSGFLLGILISVIGVIASARTCILMIRTTGNDKEYCDSLYKYWGNWAYYLGNISTLLIMIAAVCSYFIMLSQMLYTIILALVDWIFKADLDIQTNPSIGDEFSEFS
jgi:amino acid permease